MRAFGGKITVIMAPTPTNRSGAPSNPGKEMETIAVTGATGFVGRYVVRALVERGFAVRALVRSREKAKEHLPGSGSGPGGGPGGGVKLVVGDVLDSACVQDLVGGCAGAIHLVGIIREERDAGGGKSVTFKKSHVEATRTVVAACAAAGVQRYIHMSALGASPNGVSEYQRTKFDAENLVRFSTLHWTIFRPGLIHGPDGDFVQMIAAILRGKAAPYLFAPYFTRGVEDKRVVLGGVTRHDPFVQPVAVEDVANAFVSALTNPEALGEVYNLVGAETLDWPTMLRFMCEAMGAEKMEPWGIPSEPAAVAAMIAGKIGLGGLLPFDAGMARMGAQDSTASLDKFRSDFRFDPRPFRPAFKTYAASL